MWVQPVTALQPSNVHGLISSQFSAGPLQLPPLQVSGPVQLLPSLHALLLAACAHPPNGEQLSSVHALRSSQFNAAPGLQTPVLHVSPTLQTLPSASQDAPLAAAPLNTQAPVNTLQLSIVQTLPSLHTATAPLVQAPALHTSPAVHALPSLHALPLLVCVQPTTESQASLVQELPSSQFNTAPALQFTPLHTSGLVQTLLSALQGPPGLMPTYEQAPVAGVQVFVLQTVSPAALQVTIVTALTLQSKGRALLSQNNVPLQKLPSSLAAQSASLVQPQVLDPLIQTPPPHTSPVVQPLPSSQASVLLLWVQPVTELQPSVVQALLSLQ